MVRVFAAAELARHRGVLSGDRVPARASAAEVVERREAAGQLVRFVVGRRGGADEADALGHGAHQRQRDGGIEGAAGALDPVLLIRDLLGEEYRMQLSGFGGAGAFHVERRGNVVGGFAVARHPRAEMKAQAMHERSCQNH